MSDVQRTLYKKFMECISDCEMGMWASYNPLKAFSTCCKVRYVSFYILFYPQYVRYNTDDNNGQSEKRIQIHLTI